MTRFLAVLLWPAGIAAIVCAGALLAMRTPRAAPRLTGQRRLPPEGEYGEPGPIRRFGGRSLGQQITRFLLIVFTGSAVIYVGMVLLGFAVVHGGPVIDKPIFHWTVTHRLHPWYSFMLRATQLGDKYPVWAAAATAAVCLSASWRQDKWVPPVALGSLIVVDHFLTLVINHTITRTPPPGAGGIFPSGGTDRAVDYYGLIAYLIWREFSGQRRTAIFGGALVLAAGFSEGYSRLYLAVHWFTDTGCGLLYGCLILGVFIFAVRHVVGPAQIPVSGPAVTGTMTTGTMTIPAMDAGAREVPT